MNFLSFLLLAVLVPSLSYSYLLNPQQTPPLWPQHFNMGFMEIYHGYTVHVLGKAWADYGSDSFRVDRNDSNYNYVCQSILPNASTPCTTIFTNQTKFIIFPQKNICCKCCSVTKENPNPKCNDFLPRDWLQNATYSGVTIINWERLDQWRTLRGNQTFVYLQSTEGRRIPRQLTIVGEQFILDWFQSSYNTTEIPKTVFQLPNNYDGCQMNCPNSQLCQAGNKQNLIQQ